MTTSAPTVSPAVTDDVATYESSFALSAGRAHAVAFAYARIALQKILTSLGLRPGDEVVLSPLTCKVVPLSLLASGVRPVYADISEESLNLGPRSLGAAIGSKTKAILFQHTYGHSAGVAEVCAVAQEHAIPLIEDCAHCLPDASVGSAGRWGRAAIFSNNPGKPLPADSGGLAVLDDDLMADVIGMERDALPVRSAVADAIRGAYGLARVALANPRLYWPLFEVNRRLSPSYRTRPLEIQIEREIRSNALGITPAQARSGLGWLDRLEDVAAHRARCCAAYADGLPAASSLGQQSSTGRPLYYFPVLVDDKEGLLKEARNRRLPIVPWPMRTPIYPVQDERELAKYGYETGSCPQAERVARRLVGMPTDLDVRPRHVQALIRLVRPYV